MEITIKQLKVFSPDLTQTLNDLLAQLNPTSKTLNDEDVKEIIQGPTNRFFVARESVKNKIVGMITLVIYRIPVWKKGWIEDLVVDKKYRNQGIATKLINYAIEKAKVNDVLSLNFTSRPERETANRLYEKLGFKKRGTNVYKIEF